ncbi:MULTISPECIES: hypothetical protein [Streptomyces]|uniref:Uncharacterized protein n=1 Tax=Streptomyces cacaoi TaxID=1898 RepID=A0A4Y3QXX6_STRCI|nr:MULTISPECIES: hypothetical protein [Streptomyces]NNG86327.1 hypothetical protein [Streptomyces cacaoi]QHF93663.1 hypothetical protein DEH18_07015 [Streptomyces sp. NHF165]GEB50265.1 hypothetical protein SCA03_28160 [Streptomyces cacaoi]
MRRALATAAVAALALVVVPAAAQAADGPVKKSGKTGAVQGVVDALKDAPPLLSKRGSGNH